LIWMRVQRERFGEGARPSGAWIARRLGRSLLIAAIT
jgi:hypothetical protein